MLSADQAIPLLELVLTAGKELLERPQLSAAAHEGWQMGVRDWLEKAFGGESAVVSGVMHAGPAPEVRRAGSPGLEAFRSRERLETVKAQVSQLESAINILRMQASILPAATTDHTGAQRMPALLDIFVSQTEKDEPLVKALVDFIDKALKIPNDRIRCTSLAPYRLPGGADIPAALRNEIQHCAVFLAVLTEASNASAYVMAEIGARWMAGGPAIILRGGGFTPERVRGPLVYTQSHDLSSEDHLHQLVQEVAGHLHKKLEPAHAYSGHLREVAKVSVASTPASSQSPAAIPRKPESPQLSAEQESVLDAIGGHKNRGASSVSPTLLARQLKLQPVVMQHLLDLLTQSRLLDHDSFAGTYSLTMRGTAHVASKQMGGAGS